MRREDKFGYGFLLASIGIPVIIVILLGEKFAAGVVAIAFVVVGIAFLIAGHLHKDDEKTKSRAFSANLILVGCLALASVALLAFASFVLLKHRAAAAQPSDNPQRDEPAAHVGSPSIKVPALQPSKKRRNETPVADQPRRALSGEQIKELAREIAKETPKTTVTKEGENFQEQLHTSDNVSATVGLSEAQLSYISTHLKEMGSHTVNFVFVGSRPNAIVTGGQLQTAFKTAGWNTKVAQIGAVLGVGMQFPETSYITGPDLSSPTITGVYEILNSAGAHWNLVPNGYMGPASFGTAEVVFVLH